MGMYTGLRGVFKLRQDTPEEVIGILNGMLANIEERPFGLEVDVLRQRFNGR